MTNKQLIKKLEQACIVCHDCGQKYGVYSVGCSSTWQAKCPICEEIKGCTETRDYGYLMTGIRKLLKEDVKKQSKEVAEYMLKQEPIMTDEDLDRVMNSSYKRGPMTNQHPITPPPELVSDWANMFEFHSDAEVFSKAAQWGADAELEACLEWIAGQDWTWTKAQLREARRPKPPSLKEQALALLDDASDRLDAVHENTIRRALEALPND